MTQAVEDFFAGGVPAAKFEDKAYGMTIGGKITADPRMTQQRDYTTGDPLFYPDGNPQMQMVVIVQAYRPNGDDDGQRAFYIKGQMRQAVGEALRSVGAKVPARNGELWIKYTEDKPTTLKNGRPGNPQKIYQAKYDPPTSAAAAAFMGEPAAGAASAHPVATSYAAGGMVAGDVITAQTLDRGRQAGAPAGRLPAPEGIDVGRWNDMDSEQQRQLYDALGMRAETPTVAAASGFADQPPF